MIVTCKCPKCGNILELSSYDFDGLINGKKCDLICACQHKFIVKINRDYGRLQILPWKKQKARGDK